MEIKSIQSVFQIKAYIMKMIYDNVLMILQNVKEFGS